MIVNISLYIHIPFCDKKCYYCDFKSFSGSSDKLKAEYVRALCLEIENYSKYCKGKMVKTVYFGGGTPSILTVAQFDEIFASIRANYTFSEDVEVTIEVNPESVTREKIISYKNNGVNRVSIGLQTTDDKLLEEIGRLHKYGHFINVHKMFKDGGFDNISIDIISNLIGQSIDSYEKTLDEVIRLKPEHISSYSLMIEEGSIYYSMIKRGKLKYDDSLDREMYDITATRLKSAGYEHYEISNYCLDGKISKHNLNYWELGEYKGFGISAASFIGKKRYKNIDKIREYIAAEGEFDKINILEYEVDGRAYLEEFVFLGLRKLAGVDIHKINNLAGIYTKELESKINTQIDKGYLEKNGNILKLTKLGIDFSNVCFSDLLLD